MRRIKTKANSDKSCNLLLGNLRLWGEACNVTVLTMQRVTLPSQTDHGQKATSLLRMLELNLVSSAVWQAIGIKIRHILDVKQFSFKGRCYTSKYKV